MTALHTPGPWVAEPNKYQEGQWLVKVGPPSNRVIAYFGDRDELDDTDIANANLIASAPALLEALEALQREFFPTPHPDDYAEWIAARAAINSARGSVG